MRKVLETLDLRVNRLIRVAFGPFELGELDEGAVEEVPTEALKAALGPEIVAQAEADFDAPLIEHDDRPVSPRHPEAHARQSRASQDNGSPPRRGHPNDKKKQPRRDRTGGPRPKYPRQK